MKKNNLIAALAYAIPLFYQMSSLSEKLSLIPSLIMICSGIVFVFAFRNDELIKFHGLQSFLVNAVPMIMLYIISIFFRILGLLSGDIGLSIYMIFYSTAMLIVILMPFYGIINAVRKKIGNIPFFTKKINDLVQKI